MTDTIPSSILYGTPTRRSLVEFAQTEMTNTDWYSKGELADYIDTSETSVRKNIDDLVTFGVLDVRNADANIPHYQRSTAPTMTVLEDWHGVPLSELFAYDGRRNLVEFFLVTANPSESYSKRRINTVGDVGYTAITEYIDDLVDVGLITPIDGKRGTEWQLNPDSELRAHLYELNDVLYETYNERIDD